MNNKTITQFLLLFFGVIGCLPVYAADYNDEYEVGEIRASRLGKTVTVTIPQDWINYYHNHNGEGGFDWFTVGNGVSLGYEVYPTQAVTRTVIIDISKLTSYSEVRCRFHYKLGGQYGTMWWTTLRWKVLPPIYVESVTLDQNSLSLEVGQTYQLTAQVYPADAEIQAVHWESSNTQVATVSSDGLVTALRSGNTTITCSSSDQANNAKATCNITVSGGGGNDVVNGSWSDVGNYTISWYNKNQTEFTLTSNKELAGLAYLVNNGYADFEGKTIFLGADIDLGGKSWIPFGIFKGSFDGLGHKIQGISISYSKEKQTHFGFFSRTGGSGYIKNTHFVGSILVQDIIITDNNSKSFYVGGVVGLCENTGIENCKCEMPITFGIKDIQISGMITPTGDINIGGIVGYCKSDIVLCSPDFGAFNISKGLTHLKPL